MGIGGPRGNLCMMGRLLGNKGAHSCGIYCWQRDVYCGERDMSRVGRMSLRPQVSGRVGCIGTWAVGRGSGVGEA